MSIRLTRRGGAVEPAPPRPAWPCAIRAGAAFAAKRRRLRRHMMPLERGGKHSPDHAGIDHSLLTSLRSLGARSVRRLQAPGVVSADVV